MEDDTDVPQERETKDFQFRQLKKTRIFPSPPHLPKERSNLLAISNKYGFLIAGGPTGLKIFRTDDVLVPIKPGEDPNAIGVAPPGIEVPTKYPVQHVALSSDSLTLSVCTSSSDLGCSVSFYDVRTLVGESKQPKESFASLPLSREAGSFVTDLKWNPVIDNLVAVCLSDGSISVFQVTDTVQLYANLPTSLGVTCVCWSPKGKQLAVGKQNGTVVQYVPTLQEKKVIPCPPFYESDPVKVLDILWVSTYVFAVVYAAADGSLETSPQLVMVLLPKKDEQRGERFLNFTETCYSSCSERQHHFFMNYMDDWNILLGASAASIEVSVIARPPDQSLWELWLLEDSSRAELPVTDDSDDTLPMGVVISFTSQMTVFISEEKILPPSPVLLLLSTDGVLCPFHVVNETPGAKSLTVKPERLSTEGERLIKAAASSSAPGPAATPQPGKPQPSPAFSVPSSLPIATPASSSPAPFGPPAGVASFAKTMSTPGSSFTLETSGGAFEAATLKSENSCSSTQAADPSVQLTTSVRVNLKDKFGGAEVPQPKPSFPLSAPGFSFTSASKTPTAVAPSNIAVPTPSPATGTPSRPFGDVSQSSQGALPPPAVAQKAARVTPVAPKQAPPQLGASGSFDRVVDNKDPIHNGIKEEIAHFQKELDDLKARTAKACFMVGTESEMRQMRTEADDLHSFHLEIQDTTKSLHGDIGCLKTTILEGLANTENAREQKERLSDPVYRRLLYKKPLDPRSEAQMQEIRRLHQYVRFEVQDVSDVLDLEWDRFVESKKKQKGYAVSDRETLFNTLANNREIINQQRQRLNQLVESLYRLRLYNCTSQWSMTSEELSSHSNDVEVESLRDTLSKTTIDTTIKPILKPPPKLSPVKQNQLRNFLTKRKIPPVRTLAPANLSRSSFLNPNFIEDLDDVSSSSSLSEAADIQGRLSEGQQEPVRQETPPLEPSPIRAVRHAQLARTVSVQQGFGTPAPQFGKVQPNSGPITSTPAVSVPSMRVIPPGADSTMLATKTVKHGAPPASAAQAAAAAAMRRQQITSLAPAALTESTLQTVPQVVNVKELKGNGPGPNIQLVMVPTNQQLNAQAHSQALNKAAAAQAKQVLPPPAAALKVAPSSAPQPVGQGTAPVAPSPSSLISSVPGSKAFAFSSPSVFSVTPANTAASAPSVTFGSLAPGKDSAPPSNFMAGNKAPISSGSEASAPFLPFVPPSSASPVEPSSTAKPSSSQASPAASPAPLILAKDTTQPANFMSGAAMKPHYGSPPDMSASILSVMPSSSAPADSCASTKATSAPLPVNTPAPSVTSPCGETLGSFSGLRVGQVEDVSKAALLAMQVKAQSGNSLVSTSKPADPAPTPTTVPSVPFNTAGLAGIFKPGAKSSFSFTAPPSAAPTATSAPSAVQASASAFGSIPTTQTPAAPIPVPSAAPSLFGSEAKQPVVPERSTPDSKASSHLQALLAQPSEGSKEAQPIPPACVTVPPPPAAAATATTSVPAAENKTLTAPISTFSAPVNLGQNAAAAPTPAVLSPLTPAAGTSSPSGAASTQVTSGGGANTPGSAFVQPPAGSSTAAPAAPVFGQTPSLFGQQSSSAASTPGSTAPASAFGSSRFGVTEGSGGSGQSAFGQAGSLWKPSSGSANNFSFKSTFFGSQTVFGQAPASTAAAGNSGTAGLFGSSASTSSASTFSFAQPASSSSTSTAGGGLFGQSSAPIFGQSPSTFGAFGSASSSATTTTSSLVFGFGQSAGFPASSSGTVFGQAQNTGGVFGQQPASSGGLFGAGSGASGGGGGFFSGLGGKPSQEAANKNPFETSGAGFGSPSSSNTSNLFGNSGAKSFGFGGSSTFGEQKSSGTFSAGGSVASQGFGFNSPNKTGGLGAAPVFGSPPTFGGSPGFGGAPTFGTAQSFTSPLGSTSGKVFGDGTAAASTGGFGFGSGGGGGGATFGSLANQNPPSFGALSQQNPGFGGQSSGFMFASGGNNAAAPGSSGGFSFGSTNQSSSTFGGGWRG
ncbi:nuclear pore complex protein Nup214 isoform X3 [Engystomops pustulosus]|uniref:nuclear pore complex protein Nup214 isoform X3 n=1 Tax=Engystomops pustulosus TaxID=76066 RepID=UPI003AFB4AC2